MSLVFLFFNVFFSWYSWKIAEERFAEKDNLSGWSYIALSALNAAAALAMVIK